LDDTFGLCSAFVDDFGGVADDDDDDMGMGAPTPFAFAAAGGLDTEGPAPGPQGLTLVAQPRKVDKVRACRVHHLLPFTIADPHRLCSASETRQRQAAQVQHVEGADGGGASVSLLLCCLLVC
jgi:hypothetical protein